MTAPTHGLRADLAEIASWIAPGSRVLDLGCGDGVLLDHLQRAKGCSGYGVEIDDTQVLACARRGVDVIQQNIEAGLDMFAGNRFDVVVLSMALTPLLTEVGKQLADRIGAQDAEGEPPLGRQQACSETGRQRGRQATSQPGRQLSPAPNAPT